eukprot:TRINITY_DN12543_c1_g1_i1.p1 TRINITY_DN12543_c1_g1~~TRINITY_DN12543_c1_g1_i1.p1  ORF type:complete len:597 (-),score=128.46 TRINITY_DN12543_c1_g1_i1:188-1738(-)
MKPWTARSRCSVALLMNPQGRVPSFMVSHAWGEDIEELEEAIDSCLLERDVKLEQDPAIWLCFLALYQPSMDQHRTCPGPTICAQLEREPFESVIELRRQEAPLTMIAAHTTRQDIYQRLWCPMELFHAINEKVDVWMAASPAYRQSLLKTFEYWRNMAVSDEDALHLWSESGPGQTELSLAVNTKAAHCSSVDDELRIRSEIEKSSGGYKHLDAVVLSLRKRETLRCANRSSFPLTTLEPSTVVSLLKSAGFSAANLHESGYTVCKLKSGGFTLRELTAGDCNLGELVRAGFTLPELKAAGCLAGKLKSEGYSVWELMSAGFQASELKAAGLSLAELVSVHFPLRDLVGAGYTKRELESEGLRASELKAAGYSLGELKSAGFSVLELKSAGFEVSELTAAGVSLIKLKFAGIGASELRGAGFALNELKSAGFGVSELEATGYSLVEFLLVRFPLPELVAAGHTKSKLKSAGFGADALKKAGYTASELLSIQFMWSELLAAGYTKEDWYVQTPIAE